MEKNRRRVVMPSRSNCPISHLLDIVGDKWSLLILRDLIFFDKKSYSELQNSDEKIATNILSNRLELLEQSKLITKQADKKDKRKKVYELTKAGVDMLPILLEMILWTSKHEPSKDIPQQLIDNLEVDREAVIKELTQKFS